MEQSKFQITLQEYWNNTLKSVEATLAMLSLLEGKEDAVIDNAAESLRTLISQQHFKPGGTLNFDDNDEINTRRKSFNEFNKRGIQQFNLESHANWKQLDDSTIEVSFGEGLSTALAIAVTTPSQLDEVIKEIYAAPYIAVDCEFLGQKNTLPELKLLQIAVSETKGYAIQVDIVGAEVVADKLKEVFSREDMDIVGWAFESDANAIQTYIPGLELAPVLDLQAKLLPIAVEQLNLLAGMRKYASDWEGYKEFEKAKLSGNQFLFTGSSCIWLRTPLPQNALVYAVFDVLSVFALKKRTDQYPDEQIYYWPLTVSKKQNFKKATRLYNQRSVSNSPTVSENSHFSSKSSSMPRHREKSSSYQSTPKYTSTVNGYDDNDPRFEKDLQKAIELSVKDQYKQSKKGSSAEADSSSSMFSYRKNSGRIVSHEVFDYSEIANEFSEKASPKHEPVFANSPTVDLPSKKVSKVIPETWVEIENDFAAEKKKIRQVVPGTWGQTDNDDQQPSLEDDHNLNEGKKYHSSYQHTSKLKPPLPIIAQSEIAPATSTKSPQPSNRALNKSPNAKYQILKQPISEHRAHDDNTQNWQNQGVYKAPFGFNSTKYSNPSLGSDTSHNLSHTTSNTPLAKSPEHSSTSWRSPVSLKNTPKTNEFKAKPSKETYINEITRASNEQSGSFTWSTPTDDKELTASSWADFAKTSLSDWGRDKDVNLDATVKSLGNTPTFHQEPIKFNTNAQGHYKGGNHIKVEGSENKDNWIDQEERPDTMVMAMNHIPIRRTFQGPKARNPNDYEFELEYDSEDDYEDDFEEDIGFPSQGKSVRNEYSALSIQKNGFSSSASTTTNANFDSGFPIMSMKVDSATTGGNNTQPESWKSYEDFANFIDTTYLCSDKEDNELAVFGITKPEELDMIYIPPVDTDYYVTIGFFCAPSVYESNRPVLKALQLYLSTGQSYTCVLRQACVMEKLSALKNTKFGYLLTDPAVKRICWSPSVIDNEMVEQLRFNLGPTFDLAEWVSYEEESPASFIGALGKKLEGYAVLEDYLKSKEVFDERRKKKFSDVWSEIPLKEAVWRYTSLQGLAAYQLYLKANPTHNWEQKFIWRSEEEK